MQIMRRRVLLNSILTLMLSACTGAAVQAADSTAIGKEKAAPCAGCHGENGISQTENIPSLAGQPDQFTQWQLVFFRSGARKNALMQPIVEQITNEDIRDLGAYFASLTPPKATICRKRAPRPPSAGAALSATPTPTRAPRRWRASPASVRNICSRRCTTTSRACAPAAPARR
jgi:cytochrome c553